MLRALVLRAPLCVALCRATTSCSFVNAELRVDRTTGEALTAESKNATAAAYSKAKLFRQDPFAVEPSRKVCVLIGMTGVVNPPKTQNT
eukprot:5562075-Amphidinium_carterae.1